MYLNAKKLAFLGLLLAFDVLLIILSGVIEFNTLFLLAAASFCVGIALRENGKRFGFGFYLASIFLSLLLAPNKLYCITYAAMGMYLVLIEVSFDLLIRVKDNSKRKMFFWMIKYLVFNLMFLPILFLLPKLIYSGELNNGLMMMAVVTGQAVLFLYDRAYDYFQGNIWVKIRGHIKS